MTTSHIPDFLQAAEDDLDRSNIRRALGLLRAVAKRLNCPEISKDIDKVEGRYFYMLRFLYGNPSSAQDAEIKVITDTITDIIAALSHHFAAQGNYCPRPNACAPTPPPSQTHGAAQCSNALPTTYSTAYGP